MKGENQRWCYLVASRDPQEMEVCVDEKVYYDLDEAIGAAMDWQEMGMMAQVIEVILDPENMTSAPLQDLVEESEK